MHYTNRHKKHHMKSKHNRKTKKHLVKNKKSKKNSKKYSKSKKQNGGMIFTSNPMWTLQDIGSYLMNTLNGSTVPLGSNPTNQLI